MRFTRSAIAVYATLLIAVVLSALPSSRYLPVETTRLVKAISVASPQGWAFFTRDPTSENNLAYVERDGRWVPVVDALRLLDAAGISRVARSIDAEVAALSSKAGLLSTECAAGSDVQVCASRAPETSVHFDTTQAPLCEPVLIRTMKPVPFAYGTRVSSMPSKVVIVRATCTR